MIATEGALFRLGQLSRAIEDFPFRSFWVARRRLGAAAGLAAADSDWEGSAEDLLRIVLAARAGQRMPIGRLAPHAMGVAGYMLLVAAAARHGERPGLGRRALRATAAARGPEAEAWLAEVMRMRQRLGRKDRSLVDLAAAVREVVTEDIRRSVILVATNLVLCRMFALDPEVPGLWGALPRPAESRARFQDRFLGAVERQAREALEEADALRRRVRQAMERLSERPVRSNSRLPEAARWLLGHRVLAPAVLAGDLGVSLRGAAQMLDDLVERGLAIEIGQRGSHRRFVAADDLEARALLGCAPTDAPTDERTLARTQRKARPAVDRPPLPSSEATPAAVLPDGLEEDAWDELEALLEGVDRVNARVEALLDGRAGGSGDSGPLRGESGFGDRE